MAPVAYFFLPDTPDKARFFTEEEKVGEDSLRKNVDADVLKLIAKARSVRQVGDVERIGSIVWKEVGHTLLDLKCWFTAVSNILKFVGLLNAMALRLFVSSLFLKADLVQFMYFSCNVGFSSLPGKHFDLHSFLLKSTDRNSVFADHFERYGVQCN